MADFITKKENMRRLAIIIVCVLFDAVALAVGIYAVKETTYIEEKPENPRNLKKVREEVAALKVANLELMDNYLGSYKEIGWRHESVGTADRFVTSPMQGELLKRYLSDIAKAPAGKGDKSLFESLGITKYKRWDEAAGGENLTLTRVFDELLAKEGEYKTKIEELKAQIEKEKASEKQIQTETDEANKKVMAEIAGNVEPNQPAQGLIGELIRLSKDLNALQKSHSEELITLEKEAVDAQNRATETKNENSRKIAASKAAKADFERRIYAIRHHREEARERREPDGEILAINEARQLAYINLLRKDRLFKGTKFSCYSLEKGGQKLDKGVIEVVEVREDGSSVCAILTTADPDWPLKTGDRIYNELYEGNRAVHIAFAGRFSGKLSNEEAAAFVRKSGNHYQEKVDDKTNYVVVADGYEDHPNYKHAVEYGIKILREKILHDYLGVSSR